LADVPNFAQHACWSRCFILDFVSKFCALVLQERLANANLSARQQCVNEGP